MRRRGSRAASVLAAALLGGCSLLTDLGGLAGVDDGGSGDGGSSEIGEGGQGDGSPSTADASPDAPNDAPDPAIDAAPYTPLSTGDMRFYYARSAGDLWYRTWSYAGKTWAPPIMVASHAPRFVPWVQPAIGPGGIEAVTTIAAGASGGSVETRLGATGWPLAFATPDVIAPGRAAHRGFDVTYGAASGASMVVYADGTAIPKFRTTVAGAWTAEQPVFATAPAIGLVDWVKLVRHPSTDEASLVYSDTNRKLYAAVWNGTTWDAAPTVLEATSLNVSDFAAFTAAYENLSGDLLVVWALTSTCNGPADPVHYSTKASGTSAFSSPQLTTGLLGSPGMFAVASEPGSNRIAFSALEYGSCCINAGCNDWGVGVWDGAAWAHVVDLDMAPGVAYTSRTGTFPVGVGWVGTTGQAVALYLRSGTDLGWAKWTAGANWVLQAPAPMTPPLAAQVNFATARIPAATAAANDDLVVLVEDVDGRVWAKLYDGIGWIDMNGGMAIAENVRADQGMAMGVVVR